MIKSANLCGNAAFGNGFSGRSNSSAVAAVNDQGQFGFLPGDKTPYTPIGGRRALALVLDCLEFRNHDFGAAVKVTVGRKL